MGQLLPLAMYAILGVLLLFLGHELFDGWLRRYHSAESLAYVGSSGKSYWRAHVWHLREHTICHCRTAGWKRSPTFNGISGIVTKNNIDDQLRTEVMLNDNG